MYLRRCNDHGIGPQTLSPIRLPCCLGSVVRCPPMRRLASRLVRSLTRGDGRFYLAGVVGVVLGLCLMASASILIRFGAIPPASPYGTYLIFGGQIVASASGFLFFVPLMRRRKREERRG